MQLKEGTELQGGKYRIVRVLGKGGFGITYLAQVARTRKYVAIKEFFPRDLCVRDAQNGTVTMLRPEMNKYKSKFISEAHKIAQLKHNGIVKVFCVFEENGTAYYAMEYIAGQSLSEILNQREFSLYESLRVIRKVSDALAHIHSKRMLHLDIKPVNIMMRVSDNEPVIIDFGISKTYDTQGNQNTTFLPAVSPGYSPAEQCWGKVDLFAPQVDIYSLGATFYKVLTGREPIVEEKIWCPTPSTVKKLVFDSNIPIGIVEVIKKAMAYQQEDRYVTVADFILLLSDKTF